MRLFAFVSLWLLLIFSLTGCGQQVSQTQTQLFEPTKQASTETAPPPPSPSPTPASQLPQTSSDEPASQEWVCVNGELAAASESARVEMGPGPGIPASTAQGERLSISAVVYTRDCQPLSGVAINLWQTDPQGVYGPGHGTDNMQCCYYMGRVTSDANGRFDILTVKPGVYQGEATPPPAHIHAEILHPDLQGWQTEIVFMGDPHLPPTVPQGMVAIPLAEKRTSGSVEYFGEAEIITPIDRQNPADQATPPASPVRYTLRPGDSHAAYQIREKFADIASMVSAKGVTELVEGELLLDEELIPIPDSVRIRVDLRGLKTDDPQRDEKLADRWLVTDDYPFATFTSTSIEGLPAEIIEGEIIPFTLTGNLTIRDVTQPVSFTVSAKWQGGVITGDAQTTIRMSDFGIEPPDLLGFVKVEDDVVLQVHLEAVAGDKQADLVSGTRST